MEEELRRLCQAFEGWRRWGAKKRCLKTRNAGNKTDMKRPPWQQKVALFGATCFPFPHAYPAYSAVICNLFPTQTLRSLLSLSSCYIHLPSGASVMGGT